MKGAKIVDIRETMFRSPIEVTEKSVGKIYGCAIYTMVKAQEIPNFAVSTKIMNHIPRSTSTKMTINKPETAARVKLPTKVIFTFIFVNRIPPMIVPKSSAMREAA